MHLGPSQETTNQAYSTELDNYFKNIFNSIAQDMQSLSEGLQSIDWNTQDPALVTELYQMNMDQDIFKIQMEIINKINNLCLNITHGHLDKEMMGKLSREIDGVEKALNSLKSQYPDTNHTYHFQYERHHKIFDAAILEMNHMKQFLMGDDFVKQAAKNEIDNLQLKIAFLSGQSEQLEKSLVSGNANKAELEHGPLNKNHFTIQLEELVKAMLKNEPFDMQKRESMGNTFHEIKIGNKSYNLNEILQNANFSHLSFGEEDYKAYMEILANKRNTSMVKPDFPYEIKNVPSELTGPERKKKELELMDKAFIASIDAYNSERDPEKKDEFLKQISTAERMAINIYSSNFFQVQNTLLRGDIDSALKTKEEIKNALKGSTDKKNSAILKDKLKKGAYLEKGDDIKDILCACAIAKSGLAKKRNEPNKKQITYRGDDNLREDIKQQRDAAVQSQTPIDTKGFISTAADKPVLNFAFNDKSTSKIGIVSEIYGVDIAPISKFASESEVLAPAGQVLYEAYQQVGTNETIYKAKKVETLTGLRQEQLMTTADIKLKQEMNETNIKLKNLYSKKDDLNQLIQKDKKSLSPIKWASNQVRKNQITLLDRKINELETKTMHMEVNMERHQKIPLVAKKTDDDKLFNLIEEYNQKIAKNPILDQNQFKTYIDVIKNLHVTSDEHIDNRKKIQEFITQINCDKAFAELIVKAKQKKITHDEAKKQMQSLEGGVSFTNKQRIDKILKPKSEDDHKETHHFLSAQMPPNPSEALCHANKFAKEKDYEKLLQLLQLSLAHHENEGNNHSVWKFKDDEFSSMSSLLKQVTDETKNEHSPYYSRLLAGTYTFQQNFSDQIDHNQDYTPLHEEHHPQALHMFNHAVDEHKSAKERQLVSDSPDHLNQETAESEHRKVRV